MGRAYAGAAPRRTPEVTVHPTDSQERPRPPVAPSAAAVLVAAGASTRFLAGRTGSPRKPLIALAGRLLIEHTADAFRRAQTVREVVLVAHRDDLEALERLAAESPALSKVVAVVEGGAERTDSVRRGVFWCRFDVDVLCVHDAARPLVEPRQIDACVERAHLAGGALLAHPVVDTLHRLDAVANALAPVDRSGLWAAETPQCFRARAFRALLQRAAAEGRTATDDAMLWQHYEGAPELVSNDGPNDKLTTPGDLERIEAVLRLRRAQTERTAAP